MITCQISIPNTPLHMLDAVVLEHSIRSRTDRPLDIKQLQPHDQVLSRPNTGQNTPFGYTRFLVPHLWNFKGVTLFMDPDMLCLCDIGELFDQFDSRYAVQLVKHSYTPRQHTKLIGRDVYNQTPYVRKNWSSLMLFNNELCSEYLTHDCVNTASALELHQFKNIPDNLIGSLDPSYNYLVGEDNQSSNPKILHFTNGMPYNKTVEPNQYTMLWNDELRQI